MSDQVIAEPNIAEVGSAISHPGERVAEIEINSNPRAMGINLLELWRFRELLYFLVWRDVKVRYKQTVLGVAWAVIQPLATMLVFSLFFGRLAGLDARIGDTPYPVFVFTGLLPWTFFSNCINTSSISLVGSTNLITKVYFPRLIIPLSAVGVGLVDLMVSLTALVALALYYGTQPTAQLLLAPAFLLGITLAATGTGTMLSALTVAYRDFRYVVPFMVQLWMFVTPVIYPTTLIPERWRWVLALNPMAGLIEGFRNSFLGGPQDWGSIVISLTVAVAIFVVGAAYFQKVEERFADVI